MTSWNWMQITLSVSDGLGKPMFGDGGMTRDDAHAEVQGVLDRLATADRRFNDVAALWRDGAQDDTVFWNSAVIWTIYEHPDDEDPAIAAQAWLQDFANTMTAAGVDTQVAKLRPS